MSRLMWLAPLAMLLAGCGGGGPAVTGTGTLTGQVLWIETGSAPVPQADLFAGGVSAKSDAFDGAFTMQVPAVTSELTVSYSASAGSPPVTAVFNFDPVRPRASIDLGELYIGPQTVTVRGTVVDAATQSPVAGAQVSLAGRRALTNTQGRFELLQVAYSEDSLAVFLGLQGLVAAAGFFDQPFSPPEGATAGIVEVGEVLVTSVSSEDPPPLPHNVEGVVSNGGHGAVIEALVGDSVVRTTVADGVGRYTMWLPAGTYTIRATKGTRVASATVTLPTSSSMRTVNLALP